MNGHSQHRSRETRPRTGDGRQLVSAMAKVTDLLISAASAAGRGDKAGALAIGARLRHRHIDTATALLEAERFTRLQVTLHQEFDALDDLLRGISAVGELTPRTNDLVVSFGERLSSRMVAEAFEQHGLQGTHVDARSCIVTDASYGKAVPQEKAIEEKLAEIVLPLIIAGKTPVMGGFIGATVDGITTTLGRGGSDFTAALIGGGMHAGAIEIWTDVNGIMTTDPRICPGMRYGLKRSASKRRPSSLTSERRCCTRRPSCLLSKKASPCGC